MRKFVVFTVAILFLLTHSAPSFADWIRFERGCYPLTKNWQGILREYEVFLPESYDGSRPMDIVFALHGAGGNNQFSIDVMRLDQFADKYKVIVVFVQGISIHPDFPDNRYWDDGIFMNTGADDVGYLASLIEDLQLILNIRSVFMIGMSQGGFMVNRFASENPGKVDAIVTVASSIGTDATKDVHKFVVSSPSLKVPAMAVNGLLDNLVPFYGGVTNINGVLYDFVPTWDSILFWAQNNNCAENPQEEQVSENVIRYTFANESQKSTDHRGYWADSSVVLYVVQNNGHMYPGMPDNVCEYYGGTEIPNKEIDASIEALNFFSAHALEDPQIITGGQVLGYDLPTFWLEMKNAESLNGTQTVKIYQGEELIDTVPFTQGEGGNWGSFSVHATMKTMDALFMIVDELGKETNMFRLFYQGQNDQELKIKNAGTTCSYSPAAIWTVGDNLCPGMIANVYQGGEPVAENIPVFNAADNSVATFQLPYEMGGAIEIELVFGGSISNRFYLNLNL